MPVLVLGLTYRHGVKELAYSRALPLIERLTHPGAVVSAYDPLLDAGRDRALRRDAVDAGARPAPFRAIVTQTADPRFARARPGLVPGPRGRLRRPRQPARPRPAAGRSPTAGSACRRDRARGRRLGADGCGPSRRADRQRRRDAAPAHQGGGAAAGAPARATTRSSSTPASTGTRRWPARSSPSSGLPQPDHTLGIGGGGQAEQTGRMLTALEPILLAERPDAVLVYGDTNSTLAGALAAAKLGAAGRPRRGRACARSTGRCPRRSTASSPTTSRRWLFAPTPTAVANLAAEGIVDGVALVGDLMQDLAARVGGGGPRIRRSSRDRGGPAAESPGIRLRPGGYLFATVHRAENRDPAALARLGRRCWGRSPRRGPAGRPARSIPGRRRRSTRPASRSPPERPRRRAAGLPDVARAPAPRGRRPDRLGRRPARGGLARRAVPRPARRTEWVEAVAESGGRMVVVGLDARAGRGRARPAGAAATTRSGSRSIGRRGSTWSRPARRTRSSAALDAGPPALARRRKPGREPGRR